MFREGSETFFTDSTHTTSGGEFNAPEIKKNPEPKDKFTDVLQAMENLFKQYPYPTTKEAVSRIAKGTITSKELHELSEKIDAIEKTQNKLRERLKEVGVLEYQEQTPIVNAEKLKSLPRNVRDSLGQMNQTSNPDNSKAFFLAIDNAFFNFPVITKTDYENGIRETKPLLYQPTSLEEALNPDLIKKADFYFLPGELLRSQQTKVNYPHTIEDINYQEILLSVLIYNKNYGNGYRDKNGKLFIKDYVQNEGYKPISVDRMNAIPGMIAGSTTAPDGKIIKSNVEIRKYLSANAVPHLTERGLLKPDDFQITSRLARETTGRIERKKIGSSGQIMIDSVIHFVGRKFKNCEVVELAPMLGGIITTDKKGNNQLLQTFRIFSPLEAPRKMQNNRKRNPEAPSERYTISYVGGADEIELTPYQASNYHPPRRADETNETYQARVKAAEDFDHLLHFENNLPKNIRPEFNKLPLEDQRIISSAFKGIPEDSKNKFIKENSLNGLKVMLGSDYGKNFVNQIITINEITPRFEVNKLFEQYNSITALAKNFKEIGNAISNNLSDLPLELKKILPQELQEAINRRCADMITAFYLLSTEKEASTIKPKEIITAMEGVKTFLEVIKALQNSEKMHLTLDKKDGNIYSFMVNDSEANFKYNLRILLRPTESAQEGQARINFTLDFDTDQPNPDLKQAFTQSTTFHKGGRTKIESVLRIGLDRDVREGKEEISLDMGRNKYSGEKFTRTGDPLGNSLALVSETGHHNTKSFHQGFANEKTFATIVNAFEKYINDKFTKN